MRGEGLERSAQEGKPDRESRLESSGSTAGSFSTIQGKAGGEEKLGEVTPPHPRQLYWVLLHTGIHNPEHPVSFPSHGPQEKPIPAGSVKPGRLQAAPGREPWVNFVPFPPCSCPQLKLQRDLNPEMLFLALVTPGTLWLCLSL